MRIFRKAVCRAKKSGKTAPAHAPKRPSFVANISRGLLVVGGCIFLYVTGTTFFDTHEFFQGSWTGKATAVAARSSLHLIVEATPWPVQGVIVGCGIYLWYHHKWIMSIIYGILVGLLLALMRG